MNSTTDIIQALTAYFAQSGDGLVCAYLFGSHARGTAREGSDVDIGVVYIDGQPSDPLAPLDLAGRLEAALGREVDLVHLNRAPVDLVHRVLRDGVLILDRDPHARARFEVRARNEYFDLKPILDEYRRVPAKERRG